MQTFFSIPYQTEAMSTTYNRKTICVFDLVMDKDTSGFMCCRQRLLLSVVIEFSDRL